MSVPIPTFSGEVQLRRWSESSTQGVQVTFALADSSDLDPLKAKSGKRFMAVLVEIGDDEQPVEPMEPKLGPLGYWLVRRCGEPEFWNWLNAETVSGQMCKVKNAEDAKDAACEILHVASRKEIDGNPKIEADFHRLIRGPYSRWLLRRGVAA